MPITRFFAVIFCCLLQTICVAEASDRVLFNGEIYTANDRAPWASAVVIADGKFVFVGSDESALKFVIENTEISDLGGRLVLPGLIDAHTHPGMVGASTDLLEIELVEDRDALMRNIEELVAANPEREILMGGYWYNHTFDKRGPHKRDLDRIESRRPLILYDYWGHSVWANSRALEIAGVDRNTPDIIPGFSFYQRDETGEPSGWITESAASVFVNNFQSVTPEVEADMMGFLVYLRDLGVTTLLDAGNFGMDDEIYRALSRLDKTGYGLPVRYHAAFALFLPDDYATAVQTVKTLSDKYSTDRLRIDTLKIFHDGVIETRTADMFDDYLDTPGNSGDSLFSEQQLHDLIVDLDAEGINLHVHSVGDKSTNKILNAVEQAHETLGGPPEIRISICHLETVLETDFYRFRDLGVIASFTPHWHDGVGDANVVAAIGDKAWSQMRAQPMLADGAAVSFSSDITNVHEWHADSANPFVGMQTGNTRQGIEGGGGATYAKPRSELLSRRALVDGYTTGAAYQLGISDESGSIEKGKRADLIVLNQNLFKVDRYDVHRTRPDAVLMDGELVSGALKIDFSD